MGMNTDTKKKIIYAAILARGKIIGLASLVKGMNGGADVLTKNIIGVVIFAITVFIGGSYWAGKSTEQAFRDGIKEMAGYGIDVTLLDYQRGIFSATAHTEWVTTLFGDEPVTLSFNHSFRHGPILAFSSAASARSELTLPEELATLLRETFGTDPFKGKPPLTITSTFGLGGGSVSRIISPKTEASGENQTKLSWGGLDGEITIGSSYSKIAAKAVMGGLTVSNSEDRLQTGHATFQSEMKRLDGYELLFVGTSSFVLDRLSFHGVDSDSIRTFTIKNVHGETDTTINNGVLGIKVRVDADTAIMDDTSDFPINKPGLTFLYENIDAQALDAFSKAKRHQNNQQENALMALLRYQPVFSVKDASASWLEGMTTGDIRIAYVGNGNISKFSLADLDVDVQLSLPVALINRLLAEQTARGLAEKSKKQINMFNTMIINGVLVEDDDALTVDATLRDGALSLNGIPKPLGVLEGVLDF